MNLKTLALALLGVGISTQALAEPADGLWHGTAGASLSATSGNSETQALLLNGDLFNLSTIDKKEVTAYINEGKSTINGVTTTTSNKWGLGGLYNYNLSTDYFAFGNLAFDHDQVIDLSLRTLVGAGLGYHVVQTKQDSFDISGGVSVVDSMYSATQTIGGSTGTSFTSVGLLLAEQSTDQLNDAVLFKQKLEYFPGLTGVKSQILKLNASLSVSMSKSLALTVGLIDTYDSKPAAGRQSNDVGFFTGVTFKLGE